MADALVLQHMAWTVDDGALRHTGGAAHSFGLACGPLGHDRSVRNHPSSAFAPDLCLHRAARDGFRSRDRERHGPPIQAGHRRHLKAPHVQDLNNCLARMRLSFQAERQQRINNQTALRDQAVQAFVAQQATPKR